MTAARRLKPVEANDGSYGGLVLAAFDALAETASELPAFPMSEAQRRAIPLDQFNALAHSIAFEYAMSGLEGICRYMGESLERSEWWELPSQPDELALVTGLLRYLDARALRDESEATR